jgi:cysteine desulfurase
MERLDSEAARLRGLRDDLWQRIRSASADARLNGHPTQRLPNNLSVSFKNVEAEGVLMSLGAAGIAASMGSACTSESIEPSHVIQAIGVPPEWARGTLRFTLGCATTAEDIACAANTLMPIVADMQVYI